MFGKIASDLLAWVRSTWRRTLTACTLTAGLGLLLQSQAGAQAGPDAARTEGAFGRRFGAGMVFGEPLGASFKCWLNEQFAVDGFAGWSFQQEDNVEVHSDVLYHLFHLVDPGEGKLPVYFGAGVRWKAQDHDDDWFGLRFPVGISYLFENAPVDTFFEVGPVVDLTPRTRWGFNVGVGARYWF